MRWMNAEKWWPLFKFEVPGEPRGKGRPRFARASGRAYTDSATRHYEDRIAIAATAAWDGDPIARDVPVKLLLRATFARPGNRYRKKDEESGTTTRTARPDLDNICKAALDGITLAGIWADDSQVTEIHASKRMSKIIDRKSKTCAAPNLWICVEIPEAVFIDLGVFPSGQSRTATREIE